MAKRPHERSELLEAVEAFDAALRSYNRLGEQFLSNPLSSLKHLERANSTIDELGAAEVTLGQTGQTLVQAFAAARDEQQAMAQKIVDHLPAVRARNERLQGLMTDLAALGAEVGTMSTLSAESASDPDKAAAGARDLAGTVRSLSDRAEALAAAAREADFEELATQAHALHQKLLAVSKKLGRAGSGLA